MMISNILIFIAIRLHISSSLVLNSWDSRRRNFSPHRATKSIYTSSVSWTNNNVDMPKVVYGSSNIPLQSHDNIQNDIIDNINISPNDDEQSRRSRRSFLLLSSFISSSIIFSSSTSTIANARGLVRFPCKEPLLNTYHFMRCGLSELEIEDIWSTNPLFL